jgi:dihydroorotate dehydrogenase (fumarate)
MSITDFATKYIPSANPFGGELVMSFTIANDGNVSLSANATTSASTIFGIPVGSQTTSEVEEITPGSFRSYQVSVPSVGQWFYLVPKVTLQPKVDEDAINPGALQEVTRDAAIWQVPYSWLALLAFVLMIIFMIRARIKRRRRQVAEWLEFTDAEAKSKVQG